MDYDRGGSGSAGVCPRRTEHGTAWMGRGLPGRALARGINRDRVIVVMRTAADVLKLALVRFVGVVAHESLLSEARQEYRA